MQQHDPLQKQYQITVAEFIFEKITCEYGAPVQIVSDRALSFLNESQREYLEILKIRHLPTTPQIKWCGVTYASHFKKDSKETM